MVTKPTGKPRARPRLTLRKDPQRYEIAYFAARQGLPTAQAPTPLAVFMAQVIHGAMSDDATRTDFARAILDGRELPVRMTKFAGRGSSDSERWRDRHSANAIGDNFIRKLRKFSAKLDNPSIDPSMDEGATDDQKDAAWLGLMSTAYRIAIGFYVYSGNPFAASCIPSFSDEAEGL